MQSERNESGRHLKPVRVSEVLLWLGKVFYVCFVLAPGAQRVPRPWSKDKPDVPSDTPRMTALLSSCIRRKKKHSV